ncbi:MAG: 23S rRNA (uracil(1939)-C(5))-methyltransferase RlmD [Kordiimonas sp.]|nr:23S rRNA (uracil(1939)-C(5))-methyltransferase RlmD [Kordiimonas sp.]|tara:strand:- start:853 stop:2115 length:1263 start_codon:yes stop_codon:yes gene_type:complete
MTIKIESLGAQGDGVGYTLQGEPVYVPYSLPGDILDVVADEGGRRVYIDHIDTPSPYRVDAICAHFGACGGCALQHAELRWYQQWKQGLVQTALQHRGIENVSFLPMQASPLGTRRRVRLSALARRKGEVVLGFQERGRHRIVDVTECPVMEPSLQALLPPLRDFLATTLSPREKTIAIHMTQTDTGIDLMLEGRGELSLDQRMDLVDFAQTADLARISRRDTTMKRPVAEMIAEPRQPIVTLGGVKVALPIGAFLQATQNGEEALVSAVRHGVGDAGRVIDLFAGCGTFSLPLATKARVYAVEGQAEMMSALQRAANLHKGLREVVTETRDLFRRPLLAKELSPYDAVVIDPPRAGAADQIEQIGQSHVSKVVMVSCHPATFARDARSLIDSGFVLGEVQVVDQFVYSPHVELVAAFAR